jgi:hypothetical protein
VYLGTRPFLAELELAVITELANWSWTGPKQLVFAGRLFMIVCPARCEPADKKKKFNNLGTIIRQNYHNN